MPNRKNRHTIKPGETILIRDMTDAHLLNTIKSIERRAKEGITVQRRQPDDYSGAWINQVVTIKNREARYFLNYKSYVTEAVRRGLMEAPGKTNPPKENIGLGRLPINPMIDSWDKG